MRYTPEIYIYCLTKLKMNKITRTVKTHDNRGKNSNADK